MPQTLLPLPFKTLRTTRWHMLREIDGLTDEQYLAIPAGRSDNILWNVGHLLCSFSRLTYVFSGFPLPIPDAYFPLFGKGTDALRWTSAPSVREVVARFSSIMDDLERDYAAGRFGEYTPLTIGPNTIESVEEAVSFHCFHEGLHIGKIIDLKDLLGLSTSD